MGEKKRDTQYNLKEENMEQLNSKKMVSREHI